MMNAGVPETGLISSISEVPKIGTMKLKILKIQRIRKKFVPHEKIRLLFYIVSRNYSLLITHLELHNISRIGGLKIL